MLYKHLHLSGTPYTLLLPTLCFSHMNTTDHTTHFNDKLRHLILRLEDTLVCGMIVALDVLAFTFFTYECT